MKYQYTVSWRVLEYSGGGGGTGRGMRFHVDAHGVFWLSTINARAYLHVHAQRKKEEATHKNCEEGCFFLFFLC